MKVLINKDFKALAQGLNIVANEAKEEFIFDTENNSLLKAPLLELAKENKIEVNSKNKVNEIVSVLETGLLNLKLSENIMTELTNTEKVLQIVLAGFEAEKSDDDMLMEIVQAGIPFRNAGKVFRLCVEENGLRITSKKRAEQIETILEDVEFLPETFNEVEVMCERLAVGDTENDLDAVADTTTTQAMKAIKKFLKDKEIEFPKAPKKAKGGLRERYLGFAAKNPHATDEELVAWYTENTKNKSESDITKWANRYSSVINHGRAIALFVQANEDAVVCEVTAKTSSEESED